MTELPDHNVPKREPSEFEGDPLHDTLLSNPDIREAYNRLEREGYESREAHYLARKEVFGADWEPDFPEYYEGIAQLADDSFEHEQNDSAATVGNEDKRTDDPPKDEANGNDPMDDLTLEEWGSDS